MTVEQASDSIVKSFNITLLYWTSVNVGINLFGQLQIDILASERAHPGYSQLNPD
jgi:hypothetical protein